MSIPVFCLGRERETALYRHIEAHLLAHYPDVTVKHDRTQTAFVRKVQFAWVSLPRRKADAGAVMLSIGLPSPIEDRSRFLHVAEVAPGRFMHHMLLRDEAELDHDVAAWLDAAWGLVGCGRR